MAKKSTKSTLTIGIVDGLFLTLQARLLQEGHRLKVLLPGAHFESRAAKGRFNPTPVTAKNASNRVEHVLTVEELCDCDFVICETLNRDDYYSVLRAYGVSVLGYAPEIIAMETNRNLGRWVLTKHALGLKLPPSKTYENLKTLVADLKRRKTGFVIKQAPGSPPMRAHGTVVVRDPKTFISTLETLPNSWFAADGTGAAIVEDLIEGQEVCFGAWFDGERFVGPLYSCIEHKGAQNGDRGNLLTGEVGTTLYMHAIDNKSRMGRAFRKLEPALKGRMAGMVDMNTIIDSKGDSYFLEFTMRFGRPTIDLQVAKLRPTCNFGQMLFDLCKPAYSKRVEEQKDGVWADAWIPGHTVGVTVFSYGMPMIEGLIERLPAEMQAAAWDSIPAVFTEAPYAVGQDKGMVQFLAMYDHDRKQFELSYDGRHFVAYGTGDTAEVARARAYSVLKDVQLPGCTWRDDIGQKLETLHQTFAKYGIA